ncbi:MAG TPA: hypothetical protein VNM69_04255 [Bacillus sp. (in: firmicutes)]|uniref:hypothetical protein n=1 Tax=Bacillus litorisediminis TaxID=2922713 RepID=UPI001FAD0C3E|nr:hypothetical protein [Bacillus litorisediminis]HWO75117.1 hypothetical protein [Bacillus sp. (in: firmicutes)]
MTSSLYQAKVGDGIKQKGIKRTDSLFSSPKEAITEAFALKKKIDGQYNHKIEWDYDGEITGTSSNLKILKGYLNGDQESHAFYLQILSIKKSDKHSVISPIQPSQLSAKDQKALDNAVKWYA